MFILQNFMTRYISILRGINVGGKRKVLMKDLKSLYEKLGLSKVETYIQSGNVIFESDQKLSNANLELKIQQALAETYGFDVPVIVRTAEEWAESVVNNPFWKEKDADIDRLHLTFLKDLPVLLFPSMTVLCICKKIQMALPAPIFQPERSQAGVFLTGFCQQTNKPTIFNKPV